MRTIFDFDQSELLDGTGAFQGVTVDAELSKHQDGVCLGLSQLWMLQSLDFANEIKKKANQLKVAAWMDAQDDILAMIRYDYEYQYQGGQAVARPPAKPISNVALAEGRQNNKKAYAERRTNLEAWARGNALRLVDDVYRFGHVLPYSKRDDLAAYRKSFGSSLAQDIGRMARNSSVGLLAFTGERGGHACAFRASPQRAVPLALFDPNVGEVECVDSDEVSQFLNDNVVTGMDLDEHWWVVGFEPETRFVLV